MNHAPQNFAIKIRLGSWIQALIVFFLLLSCGDSPSKSVVDPSAHLAQYPLVHMKSHGKTVPFGDSSNAKFTDDFWIGKHEVTQGEFRSVMGYLPNLPQTLQGDSFPIVSVSMAEAILFCNALSVRDGLDTVYEYLDAPKQNDRVIQIEGLNANLSNNGYRLPTEAEWEYAAGAGLGWNFPWGNDTNQANIYAWTSNNSEGLIHTVCSKELAQNLCDISGNVMELVGDWYGIIPSGTLTDYAGSLNPNNNEERIVKGGSYRVSIQAASRKKRRDVYSVTLTTAQDYIGFRVARGGIEHASYSNNGQVEDASGLIKMAATRSQVQNYFGTRHVRVVLINGSDGEIYTINYASPTINWNKKNLGLDSVQPRHPSISPNGRQIAFGTRSEGQFGESSNYLVAFDQGLIGSAFIGSGAVPRWWVDSTGADTSLIFASSTMNNQDSMAWLAQSTYKSSVTNGFPWLAGTVIANGAYHGGTDTHEQWLVTSSPVLRVYDRKRSLSKDLFNSPQNGKDETGSTQVCNASISSSANPRIMFLDFGYNRVSSIIGSSYGIHEYLFVLDPSTGVVVDTLKVPAGWSGWSDPEWSNHPDFAIAAVTNQDGEKKALYAINMRTHQTLLLAEGAILETPMLWVRLDRDSSGMVSDSLGQYAYPATLPTQFLSFQLSNYWNRAEQITGVIMGSSRCFNGIDPQQITQGIFQNMCLAMGGSIHSANRLLPYVYLHSPDLQYVVMNLDLDLWNISQESEWNDRYGQAIGYKYDSIHQFWPDGLPANFLNEVNANAQMGPSYECTPFGFCQIPVSAHDEIIFDFHPNWNPTSPYVDSILMVLDSMLLKAQVQGVKVLGLMTPQQTQNSEYYGKYGLTLNVSNTIKTKIDLLLQKYPDSFRILDLHLNGNHQVSSELFFDIDHLNWQGATWMTAQVDSVLELWE